MSSLSRQAIESVCVTNGQFTVPKSIQRAIEQCIATDDQSLIIEEYHRLLNEYKRYRTLMTPAKIDYRGDLTLDAYTAFYLPRNMAIPWIALRDLSLHNRFRVLPGELRILDIGSGTGAVVLGLLHLFNSGAFSSVGISVVSLDSSPEALKRQRNLVEAAGFPHCQVRLVEADLNSFDECVTPITEEGPFDLVFIGNCITELDKEAAKSIIAHMPGFLRDSGVAIIAEAQRDYVKHMIGILARLAAKVGLSVYYPCPEYACGSAGSCWVWRTHDYDFPQMSIAGRPLEESARERLVLSWLILTKEKVSLYDSFRKNAPHLSFGPLAQEKSLDKARGCFIEDYGMCTGQSVSPFTKDRRVSPAYSRGGIVGLDKAGKLAFYHDLN